jgi:chromate transport protein ChrA
MQSWPIIQPNIMIKGRTKRVIYMLDLITTLITRFISSLQAIVTTIIYLAAFLMIRSRIKLIKVVETVLFAIILLILLTINLK